jgi:conjugative relaxase-like TrwC/TraI family protein
MPPTIASQSAQARAALQWAPSAKGAATECQSTQPLGASTVLFEGAPSKLLLPARSRSGAGSGTLGCICAERWKSADSRHRIAFPQACVCVEAVWKLRVGAEAYYLSQVASGLDEYYTGAGEAPGVWVGSGVECLGLVGEVEPADLRAVLAGLAPGTGLTPDGTTLRAHPRRVPGFDLTFSVPKSVSVAYALADRRVQHLIVTACEAALAETLGWLEREACFVRRGTNKAENRDTWGEAWGTRRMVARGFVGATYRHRTSRAGDPHLHWHVLVTNLAQGIDGRWSALDGRAIYDTARTGGAVFQAAMRRELTAALGVEWGPVHEDAAEIAGIPHGVLHEFSQRHEQIAEWLADAGEAGPAAAAVAQRATRARKQVPADFSAVEADWHARADAAGWGTRELELLLASEFPSTVRDGFGIEDESWRNGVRSVTTRIVGFDEWLGWLLDHRVTAHDGAFTRFDLTRAVASALPASTSVEIVEATVQRALASPAVVPLVDHSPLPLLTTIACNAVGDDGGRMYTSRSLLALEARFTEQLVRGVDAGAGVLDRGRVDDAVCRSTLGDDQASAVMSLTTSGDRIAVLVGRAGAGKTHTLGTIRALYEDAGFTVVGLAPSARAARELEAGAGIGSSTLARHLVEQREVDASTLVVVDEAGMAAVRDLARVVDQVARVGAKLVLVGDHHQLPEVAAGGGFRAALDVLGDRVAELTVNRRQHAAWEQAALGQLRHGDVAAAFAAYRSHGRVVLDDDRLALRQRAIADWNRLRTDGVTLMLAGTRAEAHQLNILARQVLAAMGELDLDRAVLLGGRSYAPGEYVILRRNHRGQHLSNGTEFAVDNGMRGRLSHIDAAGAHVTLDSGEEIVLDRDYLAAGWLDYGYASTVHTAQGVTCDHVLVVGPAGLYREAVYVAMSRARLSAWIYGTTTEALDMTERHTTGIPLPGERIADPEHELIERTHASGSKQLASSRDAEAAGISDLATRIPVATLLDLAQRARHAERVAASKGHTNPADLRASLDRAVTFRTHAEVGNRVRALDRDNVGHLIALDDVDGTCDVLFVNDQGRSATRTMTWSELVAIDQPGPTPLTPEAAETLQLIAHDLDRAMRAWADALAPHDIEPGDADRLQRATNVACDRAAHQLRADAPEWLTNWLGQRPSDGPGAAVWDDAVARIAHHRAVHGIDDATPGLGPQPSETEATTPWQEVMLRTLRDRIWLTNPQVEPQAIHPTMSPLAMHERRAELQALMNSAPADHCDFIERLSSADASTAEVHEHLVVAVNAQNERRDWIVANWPHVVELEQLNALITAQPSLAHWPTAAPPAVQAVLDTLASTASPPPSREHRTLAALDHEATANDPVRQARARIHDLDQLAARASTSSERAAVDEALRAARLDLRQARREQHVANVFARYDGTACDDSIERRQLTVAHDVFTDPPDWVVEHVRRLHDHGHLGATRIDDLATRIVAAAVHLDRHGHLPDGWSDIEVRPATRPLPVVEIGVPEL